VSENQWQFWLRQFAIDNMKIRPANGAGGNAHEDLSGIGSWFGNVAEVQRLFKRIEHHCAHDGR
jgi:hypothetical protein